MCTKTKYIFVYVFIYLFFEHYHIHAKTKIRDDLLAEIKEKWEEAIDAGEYENVGTVCILAFCF